MRMTYKEKIAEAKKRGIYIADELVFGDKIVGVYGFFAISKKGENCFYIGKATNMLNRLLGSGTGHIHMYLYKHFSHLVPQKIKEHLERGDKIEVRLLAKIDYHDTSFSKAAHRLALAEIQEIVKYQKMGQCKYQLPEGAGKSQRDYWEANFKVDKE